MVNFPCLILKVNSCLFSSFPYQQYPVSPTDGNPEHSFRLVSMKGSFKDSRWLPHRLGDEVLLLLLPGNHRWAGLWVFCVPVNRGPGFPELHALLLPMEKSSLHNPYQQISHKVFGSLSLTLIPKDEARSYLPNGKYPVIFCSHDQK